jgi:hypothetical protein
MENKRNIFINLSPDIIDFTPNPTPINNEFPTKQVSKHGNKLFEKLKLIWEEAEKKKTEKENKYFRSQQGTYIEFIIDDSLKYKVKSLEDRRKKIRILNIKHLKEANKMKVLVFIPDGKEGHFLGKIKKYLDPDQKTSKGRRSNQDLIDCIEDIKLAILESFWQGEIEWIPDEDKLWCEIWIYDNDEDIENKFIKLAESLDIQVGKGVINFPERKVFSVYLNNKQILDLIEEGPVIAEIRRKSLTADFFTGLEKREQIEWIDDLLSRLNMNKNCKTSVCVLDTGLNSGHPLIDPVCNNNCQSYNLEWGSHDHSGHGTMMAGLAIYNDLQQAINTGKKLDIDHFIESVKILPSTGENDEELYGYILEEAIYKAEIENPELNRVFCMAVTADNYILNTGAPSSWSAAVDAVTSGFYDNTKRLLFVSAGNVVEKGNYLNYPQSNLAAVVEEPGQVWNAITVGAFTNKNEIIDSDYSDYQALAPVGGLSPFSKTSRSWDNDWAIKPEILMEGGNLAVDNISAEEPFFSSCEDLSELTTNYKYTENHFGSINMTSAATAKASWFASQLMAEYPEVWPETIRALIIHSAEWTDKMKEQFLDGELKSDYLKLLRTCGYGVPNLEKARWSYENAVNLVIEDEIQPFEKRASNYRSKEMNLYKIPWPEDILLSLGEIEVKMRVTLSYFIEPGPGEIGWKDRYRYPSALLRFDLKRPDEDEQTFLSRINRKEKEKNDNYNNTTTDNWILGMKARDKGSIHSDIWEGIAADLSQMNEIAVYPANGWWKTRSYLGKAEEKMRYSLVVSLTTEKEDVELYTEIINLIDIAEEIEIKVSN